MIKHVVGGLLAVPVATEVARRQPEEGGLPTVPGFYAWWVTPGALPTVPRHPHPAAGTDLDLLYVGIAPRSASSQQTVRSRVLHNHLGGTTGSSTFRLSLAALLMDTERFTPVARGKKFVLVPEENRRLTEWQLVNLAITWCEASEPWNIEGALIDELNPPLNVAENASHPFHATIRAARQRFRDAARFPAG